MRGAFRRWQAETSFPKPAFRVPVQSCLFCRQFRLKYELASKLPARLWPAVRQNRNPRFESLQTTLGKLSSLSRMVA